jgi:hypothetical protein
MPGVDAAAGTLAVPIWLAGAAAAVLVVAVVLAVGRAGGVALITSLFRVGLIAAIVLGAWLYVQQRGVSTTGSDPGSERRSLDDRKTALMAGAIAPGSALSCLDEQAGETVESACEKSVFASPEAVAAAVKYVTAQLALLDDGSAYAERGDASYAAELAPLRTAIEFDRFGLVAHVLTEREGCMADHCDALARMRDSTRVAANMRDHTFEEQVKKYTAIWNTPHPADGLVAAVGPPVALPGAAGPGTVAPRYDFPSSKSIPPVSIMAPEGAPPHEPAPQRDAATPRDVLPQREPAPPPQPAAAAEPPAQSAAIAPAAPAAFTPVPPRRPPQVRVAPPPRSAPPRPEAGDPNQPDGTLSRVPPPPFSPTTVR